MIQLIPQSAHMTNHGAIVPSSHNEYVPTREPKVIIVTACENPSPFGDRCCACDPCWNYYFAGGR